MGVTRLALGRPSYRGGRVSGDRDPDFAELSSSLEQDREIFHCDVWNSVVHAVSVWEAGRIDRRTAARIVEGLVTVLKEGPDRLPENAEDVHEAIESRLYEVVGEEAGWLQLGRSRNDQVATSVRMRLRERALDLSRELVGLGRALLDAAREHAEVPIAGYTHLKRAQPCTIGFWFSSYVAAVARSARELLRVPGMDECPLGCSAFPGSTVPVDRHREAVLLGFRRPARHCGEAAALRGPVLEFLGRLATAASELTRLAEDLVRLCSDELGVVEPPDELSSTSSVMPHKKNPDALELVRAELTVVSGLKGLGDAVHGKLPMFYDRDLQVLNGLLWDSVNRFELCVRVLRKVVEGLDVNEEAARDTVLGSHAAAVDLAELVAERAGLTFREAHKVVGRVSARLDRKGVPMSPERADLVVRELEREGVRLRVEDVRNVLSLEGTLRRPVEGSTDPGRLGETLDRLRAELATVERLESTWCGRLERALRATEAAVNRLGVEGFAEVYRGYWGGG
ncbi:argininosuccinate lyase [Methanopyrus sp.]